MAVFGETTSSPRVLGLSGSFWGFVAIAVAIGAITVMVVSGFSETDTTGNINESAQALAIPAPDSFLSSEETLTMRLANTGLIPMAAVDWETIELKRAVARGWVPEQALQPATPNIEPVFTSEELATIDLATRGLIPSQTVNWDDVALKQLVNRGLIPKAATP